MQAAGSDAKEKEKEPASIQAAFRRRRGRQRQMTCTRTRSTEACVSWSLVFLALQPIYQSDAPQAIFVRRNFMGSQLLAT